MAGPAFSVIIPTYNRPAELPGCLAALAAVDPPAGGFEVVVVDDGGDGPLDPIVGRFAGRLDVRLIRQPNAGPGPARNAGAAAARGRFLAFTDDDCRPRPGWLTAFAAAFAAHPDRLLGGRTVNLLTRDSYAAASQLIVDLVYGYFNRDPAAPRFFASNNIAVAADGYRAVGGFEAGLRLPASEDRDLCDRWRFAGRRLGWVPAAVVGHAHALSLGRFWRQHATYGRGAVHFHRLRAARGSGRLADDMGFHAALPGLVRRAAAADRRVWRLVPLLAVWQAATAAGYLAERARAGGAASRRPPRADGR